MQRADPRRRERMRAQRLRHAGGSEALPGFDQPQRPEQPARVIRRPAQVDHREAVGLLFHLARKRQLVGLEQRERAREDRGVAAREDDRRDRRDRAQSGAARQSIVVAGLDVGDLVGEDAGQLAGRAHRRELAGEEEDVPGRRGERVEDRLVDDVVVEAVHGRPDRQCDVAAGAAQHVEDLGVPEQRELRVDAVDALLPAQDVALLGGRDASRRGLRRAGGQRQHRDRGGGAPANLVRYSHRRPLTSASSRSKNAAAKAARSAASRRPAVVSRRPGRRRSLTSHSR